ncbi:MAG: hypothetical protein IM606_09890 [Cytophagales bacterium]|jgi:hypothetical protein|nr:hypothetical protein [Cytophagales bacterium]
MAYTALNLITDVLLDMGVIADQETPTSSQSVGALVKLNDLIESWNLDPQKLYGATEFIIPFVANKATYTIGIGGDLNVPRPNGVFAAFVRNTTATPSQQQDIPITILNDQQWADIPVKGMTGTFPYAVWFNMTNPLITAYVTPIPTGSNYSLVFWDNNDNTALALNTALDLAPGYKRALKYALFIELAAGYQIQVPASIASLAISSKLSVDRQNVSINTLSTSGEVRYDILSNTIREF